MGIERFFSSLNREFNVVTDLRIPYEKIDSSHFLIDFNSIIHNVSSNMLSEINKFKQKKINKLSFNFTTMDSFEDELIIQVKDNIKNMLKDNFISDNLNYLFLALDGVPSFSKMMEQKKRRYLGDLISQLMKKVELPIEWSKNNISPGTKFMDNISKSLKDESFLKECKIICKNLEAILVSDVYNPGEGEMKIMNCLRGLKNNSNKICVYSPDSDMILLLMILETPTTLLRFDQQKSQEEETNVFNRIDVDSFKEELIEYCDLRLSNKIDKKFLIDEIVYIFTLFGDDFIPKTESISVSEDINSIIDNYLITLIDKGNLLILKKNEYSINYENLNYFFSLLTKTEIDDLNRNFYNSKFNNYRWAKTKNFHLDLSKFKEMIKELTEDFKKSNNGEFLDFIKDKVVDINKKVNSSNHLKEPYGYFLYNIKKIIDGNELYSVLYGSKSVANLLDKSSIKEIVKKYKSLYYLKINDLQLINDIILYLYFQELQFPFINFRLDVPMDYQYFIERKFEKKYHINKMKKRDLFNDNKERERLDYMIQNKLDSYFYLFNPISFFYKYKITSTEKYYHIMFRDINKNEIINKYFQGFEWVLNYYFNNKIDQLWYYPFSRTPLLSDVILNYNKIKIDSLDFNRTLTFNPLESIVFITPLDITSKLNFFPDSVSSNEIKLIESFITDNQYFFLNLKEINYNLITNPESLTDLLDCSVSIFLSKCHYKLLDKNTNPELYLKKFREKLPISKQIVNKLNFECKNLKLF